MMRVYAAAVGVMGIVGAALLIALTVQAGESLIFAGPLCLLSNLLAALGSTPRGRFLAAKCDRGKSRDFGKIPHSGSAHWRGRTNAQFEGRVVFVGQLTVLNGTPFVERKDVASLIEP
jgi:hypothetical protein